MKILHYSPDSSGIRFFRSSTGQLRRYFDDQSELYSDYWNEKDFLHALSIRDSHPDIILISAHGWYDSILKMRRGEFKRTVRLEHASLFKHKFILANSCYTAKKFGPKLVKEGALAYIGFDDSIEAAFTFNNFKSKRYNEALGKIFKSVYNHCMTKSIDKFIRNCQTARELTEYMDLNFRREVLKISKMPIQKIKEKYSVSIPEDMINSIKRVIKLEFISKLDFLNGKIVLLGEENYISWFFIKYLSEKDLNKILNKIEKISVKNNYYKCFIKLIIYMRLNDYNQYLITLDEFNKELEALGNTTSNFVSPVLFSKDLKQVREQLAI